jgi:hypothetical protein
MPCGPRRPTARQSAVVIRSHHVSNRLSRTPQAGEFIDHFSVDLLSGASHNALQPYEKRSLLPTFIHAGRDFCPYSNSGDAILASLVFDLGTSYWIAIANKDAIFAIFSANFVWITSFTRAFFFCSLTL